MNNEQKLAAEHEGAPTLSNWYILARGKQRH